MSTIETRDGSLAPVRAAIPESCYRRSTARGLAYVSRDLAAYGLVLLALARADAWWQVVGLELLAGLVVGALFILGHDASHRALFESDRLNGFVARLLMLPAFHVQEAWALGHNRIHHGFTARQGLDFVWHPQTVADYEAMSRWARSRHRLEWSAAGAGAYYLREVWWNKMVTFRPPPARSRPIRRDWMLVAGWAVLVTGASLWLGWGTSGSPTAAAGMWLKLVVLPFLVFTQIIGWAVYVHHIGPDIPWWTRSGWTRLRAQTTSTTILRMPRVLNVFFHNIFIHVPHHVDARVPWYRLPEAADAIERATPGTIVDQPFRIGDYLHSARRCKLYDFDTRTWLTYADARTGSPSRSRDDRRAHPGGG
jgi:omega-6 fatty acid desaturase (delta-12 desaturase)